MGERTSVVLSRITAPLSERVPDPAQSLISPSNMSVVLPGEVIQTQHKTIKLGPGLQQLVDLQGRTSTVVTRAGTLEQNAKGNKFWVEGNSRRVSLVTMPLAVDPL